MLFLRKTTLFIPQATSTRTGCTSLYIFLNRNFTLLRCSTDEWFRQRSGHALYLRRLLIYMFIGFYSFIRLAILWRRLYQWRFRRMQFVSNRIVMIIVMVTHKEIRSHWSRIPMINGECWKRFWVYSNSASIIIYHSLSLTDWWVDVDVTKKSNIPFYSLPLLALDRLIAFDNLLIKTSRCYNF